MLCFLCLTLKALCSFLSAFAADLLSLLSVLSLASAISFCCFYLQLESAFWWWGVRLVSNISTSLTSCLNVEKAVEEAIMLDHPCSRLLYGDTSYANESRLWRKHYKVSLDNSDITSETIFDVRLSTNIEYKCFLQLPNTYTDLVACLRMLAANTLFTSEWLPHVSTFQLSFDPIVLHQKHPPKL